MHATQQWDRGRTPSLALWVALLALMMVAMTSVQNLAAAGPTCLDGAGTGSDPFLVASAADLALVGSDTDGCTLAAAYRQTSDISFVEPKPGGANHVPIGTQFMPFTGTFDGGGFKISGLVLVTTNNSWGLFGGTDGATIRDVHIVDGALTGIHAHVGLLIGFAKGGTVVDSSTTGTVTGGSFSGGLIGLSQFGVRMSSSFSAAAVKGHRRVGGLVGDDVGGHISDSYFTGSVEGTNEVGGLVGRRWNSVSNSYVAGRVEAAEALSGGLVGNDVTTVTNAFWDLEASGQVSSAGGGTGKSTAEMTAFANFSDTATAGLTTAWKITDGWVPYVEGVDVWGICPAVNDGLPFLLWQFDSDPCFDAVDVAASQERSSTRDPLQELVALAVEAATAAGVAGTSSAVLVHGDVLVPVSSGVTLSIGQRGGVVVVSDLLRVAVASTFGARAASGVVIAPGHEMEVSITSALEPGSVVEIWMYSSPRLVAAARVPSDFAPGDSLLIKVSLGAPLDGGGSVSPGSHLLLVRMHTEPGFAVLATGVTVGGPVPSSVPSGGGPVPVWLIGMVALAVLGVRRRAGATPVGLTWPNPQRPV